MTNTTEDLLFFKLKDLITEQSEGEWTDAMIIKDAHHFANNLRPMLAASPQGEGLSADAQGWRDIATAPRDGREIVAYSQDVSGTTGLNPFVSLCAWHPDAGFCTCELREVTHWMPFPPPPSADPAPIKPSADTGELRERVARIIDSVVDIDLDGNLVDVEKAVDAILDLIQSERASSPIS